MTTMQNTTVQDGGHGPEWVTVVIEQKNGREHTWTYLSLSKPFGRCLGTVVSHISRGIV